MLGYSSMNLHRSLISNLKSMFNSKSSKTDLNSQNKSRESLNVTYTI